MDSSSKSAASKAAAEAAEKTKKTLNTTLAGGFDLSILEPEALTEGEMNQVLSKLQGYAAEHPERAQADAAANTK
jgi:hypothetical protein